MIVSWNWLKEYLPLTMSPAEATARLMMAGLNHESTESAEGDFAIDLEVTSNRPDCLGHIGVARELGVLFDLPLKLPAADPKAKGGDVRNFAQVRVDAPDLCPRYTARLISGAKVGPSPPWLIERLATLFLHKPWKPVNNVVDVTNYVLMECGQPLHAFDYRKLAGRQIVVRRAKAGETLEAIDHNTYKLDPEMCVIADAENPVAIAGVMGGKATEISDKSTDILLESADFSPLSVRGTSRKLKLRSDSSYRFERGVDPEGIDWASRRACELILDLCGGKLCSGSIDAGTQPAAREPIVLRLSQIKRILGIEVPAESVKRILAALGCVEAPIAIEPAKATPHAALRTPRSDFTFTPPSWRRDLSREIDLIEEVARIHGYDKIPEDARVPMTSSHRTDGERVLDKVRGVLTAAGCDEAMSRSIVTSQWSDAFSPWSDAPPLIAQTPMMGADHVRRSLIPSLLAARQYNESLQNEEIELFEIARIYLPQTQGLPVEKWTIGITSGRGFAFVKGVIEQLVEVLKITAKIEVEPASNALLEADRAAQFALAGERFGYLGELSAAAKKQFALRAGATIAEIDLGLLVKLATLVPQHRPLSKFPPMSRDLNLIVDEAVRWSDLAATVQASAGPLLEALRYQETYRDPAKDGADKKRLLFSLTLRSSERTLTGEEADAARAAVVAACLKQHQAVLLG
jgi:phenylalanyl-tRNA synthetase beta chain